MKHPIIIIAVVAGFLIVCSPPGSRKLAELITEPVVNETRRTDRESWRRTEQTKWPCRMKMKFEWGFGKGYNVIRVFCHGIELRRNGGMVNFVRHDEVHWIRCEPGKMEIVERCRADWPRP